MERVTPGQRPRPNYGHPQGRWRSAAPNNKHASKCDQSCSAGQVSSRRTATTFPPCLFFHRSLSAPQATGRIVCAPPAHAGRAPRVVDDHPRQFLDDPGLFGRGSGEARRVEPRARRSRRCRHTELICDFSDGPARLSRSDPGPCAGAPPDDTRATMTSPVDVPEMQPCEPREAPAHAGACTRAR